MADEDGRVLHARCRAVEAASGDFLPGGQCRIDPNAAGLSSQVMVLDLGMSGSPRQNGQAIGRIVPQSGRPVFADLVTLSSEMGSLGEYDDLPL